MTNVAVTAGSGELAVSWDAVAGATGYLVQWKSGTEDWDPARQEDLSGGSATSHTIPNLANGTAYTVRVVATQTGADDGVASEPVTGTPVGTASDVTLSLSPARVPEAAGATPVTVTATLNGAVLAAETDVRVSVAGGTATAAEDFAAVPDFTLTIAANATSGAATFVLTPVADEVADDGETLAVEGVAPSGLEVAGATLTLADTAGVTLSLSPVRLPEDAGTATTVTVTATLAAARPADTTMALSVRDGTATAGDDFDAVPDFTLTVAANQTSGTATFGLTPAGDSLVEGAETLTVAGTETSSSSTEAAVAPATLTLIDGDTATLSLTADVSTLAEADEDAATLTVAVVEAGLVFERAQDVAVAFGGTAAAGADFTFIDANGYPFTKPWIVRLPPGARSVTATLTAVDDDRDDDAETLTVAGTHNGATAGSATITITDDDEAPALALAALAVTRRTASSLSRPLYPAFDADRLHYAVGCEPSDTLTVTATLPATPTGTRLAVDGVQAASGAAVELTGLDGAHDIAVVLSDSAGASRTYTVHCLDDRFPEVEIDKEAGAWDGLILGHSSVIYSSANSRWSYLWIMDTDGVPRRRRLIGPFSDSGRSVRHFKPLIGDHGPYGYTITSPSSARIVDERFEDRLDVPGGDVHDFLVTADGNAVYVVDSKVLRDLSYIPDGPNGYFGTEERVNDTVIKEVTPIVQSDGSVVLEERLSWSSVDNMALYDCTQYHFADTGNKDYAHFNSIEEVDGGNYLISMRGCSKVLVFDGETGDVIWRVGRTGMTELEWRRAALNTTPGSPIVTGPPPLRLVDDPEGEFCGQHSAKLVGNGNLLLYDNGRYCWQDPRAGNSVRANGEYSRVVEYALDLERGEAVWVRQHDRENGRGNSVYTPSIGLVAPVANGHWLVSWGAATAQSSRPYYTMTEVNPETDETLLGIRLELPSTSDNWGGAIFVTRSYALRHDEVRSPPVPLAAEFPAGVVNAAAHNGTDAVSAVVAFSRPVVDFDEATPSVTVTGATVDAVSALVAAGEAANAYRLTLTPEGEDDIEIGLVAHQACTLGGVCAADGTTLSGVADALVIAYVQGLDTTAPTLSAAAVDGATLTLTYSETLDDTSVPAAEAFTVSVGTPATAQTPASVAVDGANVTLTLAAPPGAGETVTVSYAPPADAPLQDGAGNPAAALESAPVGNDTAVFVTIARVVASVPEGEDARFTLHRTGTTDAALAVSVEVSQTGDTAAPGDLGARVVALPAGAGSVALAVATTDDDIDAADGTITAAIAVADGYVTGASASRTVTILDDDTRGIEVSTSGLSVAEGGSATYTVSLGSEPTAAVAVTVSAVPADAGVTVEPASIDFDAMNWAAPATVTVTAAEDEDAEDGAATLDHAAAGGDYDNVSATVAVVVEDDELVAPTSFTLDARNVGPSGIWSDGGTVWVADRDRGRLFAYRMGGERAGSRDIAVRTDVSLPMGLWSDGAIVWVVDYYGGVRAYRLSDGGRVADRDIDTTANEAPTGVWSDGETVWVADWRSETVSAYRLSDGARLADDDLELAVSVGLRPSRFGMWSDGTTLWVADSHERIDAFVLSAGARHASADIEPAATHIDPAGLWSNGATLLATGLADSTVYAYALPGATVPPLSSDATLSGLGLSGVDIGTFGSGTTNYAADVDNGTDATTVTATPTDADASVAITPADADPATGHQVELGEGSNTITATVTAEDGTTLAYTVTVTRAAAQSSDATLSDLALSGIDIGTFHSDASSYAATVANGLTSTTVTATPTDANASVAITPADAGAAAGHQVDLGVGSNTITVTVTAEDGSTARTYTVAVTRAAPASDDATLSGLTLSGIDIGPFASGTTDYAAEVDDTVATTVVTATASHEAASAVIGDGDGSTTDAPRTVALAEGDNAITVNVTAEDGVATRTYTVTVTRAAVPLTAQFEDVPASHDGDSTAFTLRLRFSEPIAIGYRTLRDESLAATDGAVTGARRVNGRSDLWEIEVAPASNADVTLALPATSDCTAPDAVCTRDGKPLSRGIEATVAGPAQPDVSIAGAATVTEGTDATFTLTRTEPVGEALTVAVELTETGSMLGADPPASVAFGAGDDTATLTVATDDDAVVEDASTVTATVADGAGYGVASGAASAQATVADNDAATFELSVAPEEIDEGGSAAVTVAIANGVTFAEEQSIALEFGGTATKGTDYTVSAATLALGAGADSVAATLTVLDDTEEEDAETVSITADHAGTAVGSATATIAASDAHSTDATLSGLALSGIDIGGFESDTTSYAADVDNAVETTVVTATATHESASVVIADAAGSTADAPRTVALAEGANRITVTVTAEDGQATTAYTVRVTRAEPPLPEVSIAAGPDPVTEGAAATFTLTRTEPAGEALTVAVDVTETGAMLAGSPPASVSFGVGDGTATLTVETDDDTVVEAASEVTVAVAGGDDYTIAAGAGSADLTVEDDDSATFEISVDPTEIAEGESAAVTVAVSNDVTFAEDQTLALAFSGTATEGADYTLSAETLTLLAGSSSVAATLTALDDADEEEAETVTVAASHGGARIGTATLTIAASDAASDDATLGGLSLTDIDIAFSAGTTTYAADADNDVETTTVTATAAHAGASVAIADADGSAAGGSRTVSLAEGANTDHDHGDRRGRDRDEDLHGDRHARGGADDRRAGGLRADGERRAARHLVGRRTAVGGGSAGPEAVRVPSGGRRAGAGAGHRGGRRGDADRGVVGRRDDLGGGPGRRHTRVRPGERRAPLGARHRDHGQRLADGAVVGRRHAVGGALGARDVLRVRAGRRIASRGAGRGGGDGAAVADRAVVGRRHAVGGGVAGRRAGVRHGRSGAADAVAGHGCGGQRVPGGAVVGRRDAVGVGGVRRHGARARAARDGAGAGIGGGRGAVGGAAGRGAARRRGGGPGPGSGDGGDAGRTRGADRTGRARRGGGGPHRHRARRGAAAPRPRRQHGLGSASAGGAAGARVAGTGRRRARGPRAAVRAERPRRAVGARQRPRGPVPARRADRAGAARHRRQPHRRPVSVVGADRALVAARRREPHR